MIKYKVVKKSESRLMRFVGTIFGLFRIMAKEKFMKSYTTALSYRGLFSRRWYHTIYSPSGIPKRWVKIHEKKHMTQNECDGIRYPLRYAFSKRWRARYEVEAYLTAQPELNVTELIRKLIPYRCRPKDVKHFYSVFANRLFVGQ